MFVPHMQSTADEAYRRSVRSDFLNGSTKNDLYALSAREAPERIYSIRWARAGRREVNLKSNMHPHHSIPAVRLAIILLHAMSLLPEKGLKGPAGCDLALRQ